MANYLIITNQGLSTVNKDYLDQIENRTIAVTVAHACYEYMQRQLLEEAISGQEMYVEGYRVTKSLEKTINKLNKKFPKLDQELRGLKYNGQRLYRA